MNKYFLIFKLHWQNALTYPASFSLWRLRMFISTLVAVTLWSAIFHFQPSAFSYTESSMLTYIFIIAGLQSVIIATALNGLAEDIYSGNISKIFLQPLKPIGELLSREVADKTMNIVGTIIELSILWWWFQPKLVVPSLSTLLVFALMTVVGLIIMFIIMLLFGCIGFYTPETWGGRFLFYMMIDMTAGRLFPLNIFPPIIQQLIKLTPFPFLSYHQSQIFLGQYGPAESARVLLIGIGWIIIFGIFFRQTWQRGLKEYGALGR